MQDAGLFCRRVGTEDLSPRLCTEPGLWDQHTGYLMWVHPW